MNLIHNLRNMASGKTDFQMPISESTFTGSVLEMASASNAEISLLESACEVQNFDKAYQALEAAVQNESFEGIEIVNEGILTNIVDTIKKMFKAIKTFITNLFARITARIQAHTKGGSFLVSKYGSMVDKLDFSAVTIQGYEYKRGVVDALKVGSFEAADVSDFSASTANGFYPDSSTWRGIAEDTEKTQELQDLLDKADEKVKEYIKDNADLSSDARKNQIHGLYKKMAYGSISSEDTHEAYGQAIVKEIRDGNDKKEIKIKSISELKTALSTPKSLDDAKAELKKYLDAVEKQSKTFDSSIKDVEKEPKGDLKPYEKKVITAANSASASVLRAYKSMLAMFSAAANTVMTVKVKMTEEIAAQDKKLFMAAVNRGKRKNANNSVEEIEMLDMEMETGIFFDDEE
jgi:hypothetical protein